MRKEDDKKRLNDQTLKKLKVGVISVERLAIQRTMQQKSPTKIEPIARKT